MMELRPIITDNDGTILGGNMRYRALKELGHTEIPDNWVKKASELTDEERKRFIIEDNMPFGGWDFDILANEWEVEDLLKWGFDESELKIDTPVEEDEVPEVQAEAISKLGEIYQLGNHRLMCGDSTKVEDVERLMDGQKDIIAIIDPPYGVSVVSDNGSVGGGNLAKVGHYSKVIGDETTKTAEDTYNLLKEFGVKEIIIWGGNYFTDFLPSSPCWIVWDKRGDIASNNFADCEMAWTTFKSPARIYKQVWMGMIKESEHGKRIHPTQKPIKILADIIKEYTNQDDIVLDLFGGSGSTLIACEQLNRKCYMMELDPKYIDVIIKRWEQFTGKKAEKING